MPADKPSAPNGNVLSTLASSSNMWVQLATVGLVSVSGLSNWAATWKSSDRNQQQIVESRDKIRADVLKQIEDIHKWIENSTDEFHKGNVDTAVNRKILSEFKDEMGDFERRQLVALNNQSRMLENQSQILKDQRLILDQIHAFVEEHKQQQLNKETSPP